MPLPNFLTNIFNKGAGNLVESIGNVADKLFTSKEEAAKFKLEAEKEINRHIEIMSEHSNKATELYLKDVADARAMQVEALKQNDTFSKRFVYYFAMMMVLLTIAYDFCFFFVKFPPENKDLLNMIAGVLNTSCLVMIVSFFFGSSMGSADKQKQIEKLMNEK